MSGLGASLAVLLGVLAVAVLSMGVFAATGARRDPDAERRNSRFLMGAGDFLVHFPGLADREAAMRNYAAMAR